jgi:hypothetical protein
MANPTYRKMRSILGDPAPWTNFVSDAQLVEIHKSNKKKFYVDDHAAIFIRFHTEPENFPMTLRSEWEMLNIDSNLDVKMYDMQSVFVIENFFVPFEYQYITERRFLLDLIQILNKTSFTHLLFKNCSKYLKYILMNLKFIEEGNLDENNMIIQLPSLN